jgi:hypothetical protein
MALLQSLSFGVVRDPAGTLGDREFQKGWKADVLEPF